MWSKTYFLWLKTDQRDDLRLDMQSRNKGFCFSLNITAENLASITHHTSSYFTAALFEKVWRSTNVSRPFRFDLGKGFEYIPCRKALLLDHIFKDWNWLIQSITLVDLLRFYPNSKSSGRRRTCCRECYTSDQLQERLYVGDTVSRYYYLLLPVLRWEEFRQFGEFRQFWKQKEVPSLGLTFFKEDQ